MPTAEELNQTDSTLAFYEHYTAAAASPAYAEFCTRLFGRNYAQHGFADMAQIDLLLQVAHLTPASRVLELGCGNGGIAAYIASVTDAQVTGIDYAQVAIAQAQALAAARPDRLTFQVADIGSLPFPPATFDAIIAIDTLYFTELTHTVRQLKTLLTPGGQLLAYYSQGANPQVPLAVFPKETLPPACTDLAVALREAGFAVFDLGSLTAADYRHAQCKQAVLEELQAAFVAEGADFLYASRIGEAHGVIAAVEASADARYLYRAVIGDTKRSE